MKDNKKKAGLGREIMPGNSSEKIKAGFGGEIMPGHSSEQIKAGFGGEILPGRCNSVEELAGVQSEVKNWST